MAGCIIFRVFSPGMCTKYNLNLEHCFISNTGKENLLLDRMTLGSNIEHFISHAGFDLNIELLVQGTSAKCTGLV